MRTRRQLIKFLATAPVLLGSSSSAWSLPEAGLTSGGSSKLPAPIDDVERVERLARAQTLMRNRNVGALVIEAGSSMAYFSGLEWRRASRLTALIIPAIGSPLIVTPAFEESKLRELMNMHMEVRVWQEHENPFQLIRSALEDRKVNGPIGLERTVRFFVVEGLKRAVPGRELVSATSVVSALRQVKSSREIELMQAANDITMDAYREIFPQIGTGMTGDEIRQLMTNALWSRDATPTFVLALVGVASSYPHGSKKVQVLKDGDVILMDCGCDVHGYKSDISRTWVHGEPSTRQRKVWDTVRKGQDIVMETASLGIPIGSIDDAVRSFYEREGWGPGYVLPGLSHRAGHGIGMDVHEDPFVVSGNNTTLAPGMCFSNEPGIYLPGEFGVRTEDCMYMTENGPKLFSKFASSIENPMGEAE